MTFVRPVLWTLLAALTSALLFVLIFDRYSYYDYREAHCRAGSVEAVANLIGSFGEDRETDRASPYYLRIRVVGQTENDVAIGGITLTSSVSKQVQNLGEVKRIVVEGGEGGRDTTVYLIDSLHLDYGNYVLRGLVTGPADATPRSAFTCTIETNYRNEWRMSWWDELMGV
jgi:hypothetical protein